MSDFTGNYCRPDAQNHSINTIRHSLMAAAILGAAIFGPPLTSSAWADFPATIDLAAGEEDVLIYGASSGDHSMRDGAIAIGDVNGDGIDDLALGTHLADGPAEERDRAGEICIYLGRETWNSVVDWSGIEGASPDVTIYGATAGDSLANFGSLVISDINGDSFDDIIAGAHRADGPSDTRADAGEVYIVYGADSLPRAIDLASSGEDVTIYGATANDLLTTNYGLAVGDVNGDGIGDVLLGAMQADGPLESRPSAGEAYVIYGTNALPTVLDLNTSDEDVTVYGASPIDFLSLGGINASGDLDGDGTKDIILGAPYADGPSDARAQAGEVYIVYGSDGLPPAIDLNDSEDAVTIFGAAADVELDVQGNLLTGDVNGDGVDDLLFCVLNTANGAAYLVFGSGSLPPAVDLEGSGGFVTILGANPGDHLGVHRAFAMGDVNGDNLKDILLSSMGDGPDEERANAGEAYIIYGSTTLPQTILLGSSGADVTIYGADSNDNLALEGAIALGDVNADNVADLILGAIGADGPAQGRSNAGESYVVYGSGGIPSTLDLRGGGQGCKILGAAPLDSLTLGGVKIGDLNGDGVGDIILSASYADGPSESRPDAGEIYILFGVDSTYPYVESITVAGGDASSVDFTVVFSEAVTGVGVGDFLVESIGVTGTSVTSVSGSGDTYTVTVVFGVGYGSVSIDLVDDDSIVGDFGTPLGGAGPHNGDFGGGTWNVMDPSLTSLSPVGVLTLSMIVIVFGTGICIRQQPQT